MAFIDERSKNAQQSEFSKQAPLNTKWTFWIDRTDCRGLSAEDYERNLKKIYTVDTVQTFWQVFNNIPPLADLGQNYSYHLMREQYRPIREDEVHQHGGAWKCRCAPENTQSIWQELLLAAIGEQLTNPDNPNELLGVSVTLRDREDMIQLWHSDAAAQFDSEIPRKFRQVLPPDVELLNTFYKAHHSSGPYHSNGGGSRSNRGNRLF